MNKKETRNKKKSNRPDRNDDDSPPVGKLNATTDCT